MGFLVAGLDMSLTGTGIAAIRKMGKIPEEIGVTTIKSFPRDDSSICHRLISIMERTFFHIPENVNFVAIESTFLSPKFPASAVITVLGMIMRDEMKKRKIKYIDVAPVQLKKFATGSSKAKKSEIMMCVLDLWGHKAEDDNQADAIVLAQIAKALKFPTDTLTKAQCEVIARLRSKK